MSFPIARRNPYIIGRPITEANLFFGRESLFQFVADNLHKGSQVILLHGQRRIGKSSVLAQIPNFVDLENFTFVPLSLEGDSQKPLGEVLHELARDSLEHFGLIGSIVLPSISELEHDPKIFVDRFLLQLRHALKTQNLVLLLDEFDAFYSLKVAAGHLFQYLQSEVYHHPDLYIIPVVGRQLNDLPELVSLFREAPNQEVGLLDRRSAERLITKPAEGLLDYSQDAIDAILELSAGHPYFTQVVCFAVFSHAREEDCWQVTRADVESTVGKAIELGEGGLAWFWDGLPIPEQVVFSAAAEVPEAKLISDPLADADLLNFTQEEPLALLRDRGVILTPSLHDAVFNLVDWKFLQVVESKLRPTGTTIPPRISTFRVTIELVRRWLVKRHALQHEIWELERLDPEVDRVYQEIRKVRPFGVTLSIISRLTPILAANPNHFGALFEMAECLMEIRNFSQAVKYYDRAYRVDPVRAKDGFLQALWDYGEELREEGHLEEARETLEQALEIVPDSLDIREVLEKICKEEKYSDYFRTVFPPSFRTVFPPSFRTVLPPSSSPNGGEVSAEEVPEIALESDLTALKEKFGDVWELVEDQAPADVKDRALERLDELKEIFTTQELNLTTMAYVQQWFMKHVPAPLNEAVSRFLEEIISKVTKGETSSK